MNKYLYSDRYVCLLQAILCVRNHQDVIDNPADIVDELRECLVLGLSEREVGVLTYRFGLDSGMPHTLQETGNQFGVGRERIRQIEAKALRKLRHPKFRLRRFLVSETQA